MKNKFLLFLQFFCLIADSKENSFIKKNVFEIKENQNNNNVNFNNISLENVYDLNINEKRNITINNLTQFMFVLKNLTINSEINLNISPNSNNIKFENIIINDKEYSNLNISNNNIYLYPKNKTVKIVIRTNLIDKEKKHNSFYISLNLEENENEKYDTLLTIVMILGCISIMGGIGILTSCKLLGKDRENYACEIFLMVYCCCFCCCTKNKANETQKKKFKRKKY